MEYSQEKHLNHVGKKTTVSVKIMTQSSKLNCFCHIVNNIQDLKKQNIDKKKIADEEYLRALKIHVDPRKQDPNISFELLNSIDKLVSKKIRPMSVEPNQRLSFEN